MKIISATIFFLLISISVAESRQMNSSDHLITVDIAHNPVFWGDPSDTGAVDANRADRIRYLASQLQNNAAAADAQIVFLKEEITPEDLSSSDLLFIHVPSARYSESEVEAIHEFLRNGGSLFLAFDVDGWATLEQANVNDIINPFEVRFDSDSPDTEVGAATRQGDITKEPVKIPYHGGRIVNGGTPFAFTTGPEEIPFGVFTELNGGGKIIVMGDAMASLYMNSWQEVDDYRTEEFMQEVLRWLLQ